MTDIISSPGFILFATSITLVLLGNAVWRWRKNRAYERISPGYRLLRGPGESLRRRIAALDDELFTVLSNAIILPLVLLTGYFVATFIGDPVEYEKFSRVFLYAILPLIIAAEALCLVRMLRLLTRRRNLYLGYFGERVVSESLDTLRAKGAAIFHDLPLQGRAGSVNIDHVVVCAGGIFAIETKTRRKGPVPAGRVDGKIIYDGAQLAYPWGADTHGLSQAMTNALWLDKNIDKTGLANIAVQPILTFPGWRIEQTETAADSTVLVLNPAQIPLYLETLPQKLSANQIKHIAAQFEPLCRDVEF